MEKYHKVFRKDYEEWYQENQEYRELTASDPRWLRFHLMPETGWLNDPNGLCQLDGQYHIYYQYTPFEPTGGKAIPSALTAGTASCSRKRNFCWAIRIIPGI